MRIAFISHEFPPDTGKGGIGTYVQQIATAMADHNWDVHVFAGSKIRSGSEFVTGYNVHRIQCTDGNDFKVKVVPEFAAQHSIMPFDVMESPEINGNAWEIKKKFPNVPLIVRLHAPNYLVESLKKKYIPFFAKLRFLAGSIRRFHFDLGYWRPYNKLTDADYEFTRLADYITAPSQAMKNWVIDNWQTSQGKVTVIPNLFFPSQALSNIPIFTGPVYKRIVFFGRLNVLKGLVNATKAMKKILQKYPDWQFRVIGDDGGGPSNDVTMKNWMKTKLERVIRQVEFLDGMPYEKLPAAITECEIVLLPSLFESFSYTCAEAMAAGKAIVGSNNAAMADLLTDKQSGLLVNPYNHHEICSAITGLIDNDNYRIDLATKARHRILHDLDARQTADRFDLFYKKVIQRQFAES